jgi:UDP-N-acetylglucosamine 2-epimerase (hydrolysing)
MTRKILFLTGTRADFGKIRPLIDQVRGMSGFDYEIFATGMHTLSRYGSTLHEIQKAGFENIHSYINQDGSVTSQMDMVLANTIQGLGHFVRESRPDMILLHGDRVEALAGAIVGSLNNILVAHVEGGELSGTIDELIRHAITKLSHLHFVSNEEAAKRLVQMGELPQSVFVIGSPDIDIMLSDSLPSLEEVLERYDIPFVDYLIVVYHPVTTELDHAAQRAAAVFEALRESGLNCVCLYPNNDHGCESILHELSRVSTLSRFKVIPSMRFEYFLSLLRNARAIVGNSSAGIREAPVYGVPTLNIGSRQFKRYKYVSIVDIAESKQAILDALSRLPPLSTPSLYFGCGDSAERFRQAIYAEALWETSPQKQFRDISVGDFASLGSEMVAY